MNVKGIVIFKDKSITKRLILFLLLAVLAWFTRFYLSSGFGLYEDDLTFIPAAIETDFAGIMSMISGYFSSLSQQGRPFMWSWVVLLSHLGWRLGGLQGMYVIAYLVWMMNITLFVLLLNKSNPDIFFVAIGGIAYVVFSADTNQAFLFNAFGLQTALTFLLFSLHFYLSNPKFRWFSYILLGIVILTYETPYWLFLAAPLLTQLKRKDLLHRIIENTLILTVIFFIVYYLRYISGESRVAGLGFPEMIITPIEHMAIGPFVGLGIYVLRPLLVFQRFSRLLGISALIGSSVIFIFLFWLQSTEKVSSIKEKLVSGWRRTNILSKINREMRLAFAGLIMLVFAYPLTILLRAYAISGRETRVHLAAVVGVSLIIACVVTSIYRILVKRSLRLLLVAFISILFGLNFAFGFLIQQDYVRAWDLQKDFWRELLPLIPDLEDRTIVLVEPSGIEDVLYINANTWVLPRMLTHFYHFPDEWERTPSVFRLVESWEENIIRVPGYFSLDGSNVFAHLMAFGDYAYSNSIYITIEDGQLMRHTQMELDDEIINLKPIGKNILSTLETEMLYDIMVLTK